MSSSRDSLGKYRDYRSRLFEPVPIDSLAAFRVFFGLMTALDCYWFFQEGWIGTTFIEPVMLFKYYGFGWVHPWPGNGMYVHFAAVVGLALCVSAGLFYRVTSVLLAIGFTYIFLLEKAIYLNHMYLICLVTGILAVIPAHRAFSLDVRLNPRIYSGTVPRWCLWLVRFQVGLPYVYGGFAKFDRDWLSGDVMSMFFLDGGKLPILGTWMSSDLLVICFTWGGMLFDLFIVPLLLWKRTQFAAFSCMCLFHLINSTLFQIGIFPWLMIGASTIFLPPDWPRRLVQATVPKVAVPDIETMTAARRRTIACVGIYVAFQLVFPFRQLLFPGDPSWTDEGQQFSWRMMIRSKLTRMEITAVDPVSGKQGVMALEKFLNPRQIRNLSRSPDMMLQFSHFLEREHQRRGGCGLEVYWRAYCSLNGRKPQLLIDPNVNLAAQKRSLSPAKWIVPLTEPGVSESIRSGQISSLTRGATAIGGPSKSQAGGTPFSSAIVSPLPYKRGLHESH